MRLIALAALIATPAMAGTFDADGTQFLTTIYHCERGVTVPVTYINTEAGASVAIMQIEGRQVPMAIAPSGSGARYLGVDPQRGYELHGKGDAALISVTPADGGEMVPLYHDCTAAP